MNHLSNPEYAGVLQDAARYPRRSPGCPLQIASADRKVLDALLAEFNDADIADRAMRVIKGLR